ncbi:MAG: DNRLRE domain-containing protein [Eubacterium sp.]|nr:DNRLRE domain-containing protein [Eubacterium sp.]
MNKRQMKQLGKMRRKIIALALIVALVITGMNLDMMPQSIYATQEIAKEPPTEEKVTIVKELVDERTENSNTYLLSDGSKQAEIFTENIRFEKDGELFEYNPELTKLDSEDKELLDRNTSENTNDFLFVNDVGDSKQYFPKKMNKDTGIVLNNGKYVVGMTPKLEEGQSYAPDKSGDIVTYASNEKDISYEYISLKDGVKENIILNTKPEKYIFEYKIETKNTYLKQRKNDRGILVCDSRTDKIVGYIAPPNIKDGDENTDYENVTYSLIKKNNETVITLSVNEMYFENENLKYPVTIDPTMQWMSNKLTTTGVWSVPFMADSTLSQNPLTVSNYLLNTYPYNSENRIYLDTKNLLNGNAFVGEKAPLKGKYIESATLTMSEAEKPAHYPAGTVQIKRALGEWNPSTITWNTQPDVSEDYIAETVCSGKEGARHTLDITDWVQDIADEKFEDYGLVFTCPDKGMSAILYGPEFKYILDENGRPKESLYMTIVVNYREMESYDASVELSAEYNSETGKIETKVTDQNELPEGTSVSGYKIYERKEDSSNFTVVYKGTDISEMMEISPKDADNIDLRVCILYSDGTVRPSNIVSLKKMEETDDEGREEGESTVTYEQTTIDTDGDGLEDGYEIWDFKTLWNTETGVDEEGNKIYDLDTDKDGFPDSYEVFTLGTDPAVANEEGKDSDGDGLTDLEEYEKGTDPWLKDSDFDNISDRADSTPRKTNGNTKQSAAAAATVHLGLYDRQYSEYNEGVLYSYITNIFDSSIKRIYMDYEDSSLNKTIKYFYDNEGNNTAVVEQYDGEYDPTYTQLICITYTYDGKGNVVYICDQKTKYTMNYDNEGNMQSLKVGNQELINCSSLGSIGEDNNEKEKQNNGTNQNTSVTKYGNEQSIKTVKIKREVEEGDEESSALILKTYYGDDVETSYITEYNNNGDILKFTDNTQGSSEPIVYNYTYTDSTTIVTRNDGFIKTEEKEVDSTEPRTITKYNFKDILEEQQEYFSSVTSKTADGNTIVESKLYNGDIYEYKQDNGEGVETGKMYSDIYGKYIFNTTQTKNSDAASSYNIDIYAEDKNINYTYDLVGNIIGVKVNKEMRYEYEYDVRGRLSKEKDYANSKYYEYDYNETGNIYGKTVYDLDEEYNKVESTKVTVQYEYENEQWPDQMTSYANQKITYDNVGNPLEYKNGMVFEWDRGQQLKKVLLKDESKIYYRYNVEGKRTYKITPDTITTYEWDGDILIREKVNYRATNINYDIWYFYDNNNNVLGYEYSYINEVGQKKRVRIYYEKDMQGNVIGLLDSRGAEIAVYSYDAWGNITDTLCYEGYETAYKLNHFMYRSYYRDSETNLYYLVSRYYDSETCRFINANVNLGYSMDGYNYNMYIYCNNKPNECYSRGGITNENILMKKRYSGQESGAYGYGGITDCRKYLVDRYGGTIKLYSCRNLTMPTFTMREIENNAQNCTLVAITRMFKYYLWQGYKKIDSSNSKIYNKVKKVAKNYGYTNKGGTGPTKINNIVDKVADNYGYGKSKCKGIYVLWNFNKEVKKEIDAGRPVIMNIATGYYRNHSVTVCGYNIYRKQQTIRKIKYYTYYYMITVYDGWTSSFRYIDYNAFSKYHFGSFNKTTMKSK